jgi:hypothetical protein
MGHEQFEHQNVAIEMGGSHCKIFQIHPNTVEMAASSFKMLQIARSTDRTGNPQNCTKRKTPSPNKSGPLYKS